MFLGLDEVLESYHDRDQCVPLLLGEFGTFEVLDSKASEFFKVSDIHA